jgi:putative CocE/NonD family hydrolase
VRIKALIRMGLMAVCCLPVLAAAAEPTVPVAPGVYTGFQRTSLYVPSWDGTRLAIDIYRPTVEGQPASEPLPVIFMQARSEVRHMPVTGAEPPALLKPFLARGYVMVLQDRRGVGASFGVQKGFVTLDDAKDGAAVIDWAGSQTWSTGKVGAMGCSNQGAYQLPVAAEHPKHLVALAPECASPFFFENMMSQNGVSSFAMGEQPPYTGACDRTGVMPLGAPVDEDNVPGTPLAHAAAEEHRCNAAFLGQYGANMHRDTRNAYLDYAPGLVDSVVQHSAAVKSSGVRIYHIGGWFDASPAGQLEAFEVFGERILIGPWTHCGTNDPGGGFADAAIDRAQDQLRWFDYTLKGIDDGISREPPVRFYTMNAEAGREWHRAPAWPLPDLHATTYFLAAGPSGSIASLNDGVLSAHAVRSAASDRYQPDYGVSLFDGKYDLLHRFWTGDMASTDSKGLTYTLAALTADLQVTGHPIAHLWISSSAPDEDFFAVLEDVSAEGHSTYVTDGKIRASRRKLSRPPWGDLGLPWHAQMTADDEPLPPGRPTELVFDFTPTSWVFRAGHRLRITVLNAAGKSFQAPPDSDRMHPPTIRLYRGAGHGSRIILPVIEPDSPYFAGHRAGENAGS